VSAANAMFNYNYMVVLNSAPHTNLQVPYFRAEVLDASMNPIPCLQYYIESDSAGPPVGFFVSTVDPSAYYCKWTANSLNLKPYIGTNVTIRFTAAGCTQGGHYGYAYVDASCGPVQVLASSPEVCLGNTLTLTAPGAGITGTYAWQTLPTGTAGIAGTTTAQTVTINAPGHYQVTVTQAPGCFYTIDTVIAFYPNPTVTVTSTNASCSPGNDGTATAAPAGGNAPYTYTWTGSGTIGPGQGTATITSLPAGTYTCSISSVNGCTTSGTTTVTQPPGAPVVTITNTPASCSPGGDGTATATASGTPGPYTYTWSGGTITGGQGTATATGLSAGTYTCVISSSASACPGQATTVITQPNGPTATASTTNVSCFGLSDGTATVTGTGGSAPLTYAWNPNASTSSTATGLAAGTYTCTTSDSKGCSVKTTVTITQPPILTLNAAGLNATCNGKCDGQLICIPAGGTPAIAYSWNTGCTSASCNAVCAGTYTCTITDSHGCTANDTALVKQPTPIVLTMFPVGTHCGKADGRDSVFATGGTPVYTYSWAPGAGATTPGYHNILAGTYTATVTDHNGCVVTSTNTVSNLPGVTITNVASTPVTCFGGSDGTARDSASGGFKPYTYLWTPAPGAGQGTPSVTGLPIGTYTCVVTDSAGCKNQATVTIDQPTKLTVQAGPPVTLCIGQCTDLTAAASGGSPAYTYSWTTNGGPLASTHVCPTTTPTTYTVTATDSHGCVSAPSTTTVILNPPLEVVAAGSKSICPGASAPLTANGSGGNGAPYTYLWMPATGLSSTTAQNPIATPAVTTTYTVIVADNCGTPTDSAMVTVTLYPNPVVSYTASDTMGCAPICINFTGSSTPNCAIGTWNFGDGSLPGSSCGTIRHCYSQAGNYSVSYSVVDINGCKGSYLQNNFVNALPRPEAAFTASPQPATIIDPTISFTDQSTCATPITWAWSFGDFTNASSTIQNPRFVYPDTGCYNVQLIVTASNGCTDSIIHPVCIQPYFTFYAPNTFTPNGDGKNDVWMPYGIGIDINNYDLIMFDRWGNLMWETHTWGEGWDGRANHGTGIAQIDTYVWKVNLKDVFGIKHSYIGHCNIIK
jgi:gliding motility-associated-like protein